MDLGSLAGVGLALGAILLSMILDGGNPASMIAPPAMVLVFGGTFGAAMASGMLKDATGAVRWFKKGLLGAAPAQGTELIDTLVVLAEKARKEGLLALEEAARGVENDFLRRGLELAVDGTDPEELRDLLEAEIDAKRIDDKVGVKFFNDAGGFAPTLGIIGTVLGLVHVLTSLSNPGTLGKLIANAFIATLWGVMSANVFWLPLGKKLARLSEMEIAQMEMLIEGISAIQAGANPRLVRLKLVALLPPDERPEPEAKAA